jgi:hypothetical protein
MLATAFGGPTAVDTVEVEGHAVIVARGIMDI